LNEQVLKDIIKLFLICQSAGRKVEMSLKVRDFWSFAIPRSGTWGSKQLRLRVSVEQSPQKFLFFISGAHTKNFFQLRNEIFAGFVRRVTTPSRRAGCGALTARRYSFQISFSSENFKFVSYCNARGVGIRPPEEGPPLEETQTN